MTAAGKITAAALAARVASGEPVRVLMECGEADGVFWPTSRKTGVETLAVTSVEANESEGRGFRRRTARRYVFTTSAGQTVSVAPAQTFILAPEDAAAVKRAHAEAIEIERERNDRAFLKAAAALATDPGVRAEAADLLAESTQAAHEQRQRDAVGAVPAFVDPDVERAIRMEKGRQRRAEIARGERPAPRVANAQA
ncbi:hypothetical protein, partial [Micromonospora sp. KC213]|uniref:hypothetical protein n=1 Tax=Micromonospora sp. KC213 TaxID=2530378 RepID=UPI0010D405B3